MMSSFRQAWMARHWQGILLICLFVMVGVSLFGPSAWHDWAEAIMFGLLAVQRLGIAQATPRGSWTRHSMVALASLPAAVCGMFALSAVEAAGVHIPWATPLRFVLPAIAVVCFLYYLIFHRRPDLAGAR